MNDHLWGKQSYKLADNIHILLTAQTTIVFTLVEICKWCALNHIKKVNFDPLNVELGQPPRCGQHFRLILIGKSQDNVDADVEATPTGSLHCIHKGCNVVAPVDQS